MFGPAGGPSAVASIDGGARGNPGPAGYGVRIQQEDGTIVELKQSLGIATNNVAEYSGLLAALRWVSSGLKSLSCAGLRAAGETDERRLRVRSAGLQPLFDEARLLARSIGRVTFEHVRRESTRTRSPGQRGDGRSRANPE